MPIEFRRFTFFPNLEFLVDFLSFSGQDDPESRRFRR